MAFRYFILVTIIMTSLFVRFITLFWVYTPNIIYMNYFGKEYMYSSKVKNILFCTVYIHVLISMQTQRFFNINICLWHGIPTPFQINMLAWLQASSGNRPDDFFLNAIAFILFIYFLVGSQGPHNKFHNVTCLFLASGY